MSATAKLLTVPEVAAILRASRRKVLLAIRHGKLRATKPLGSFLITQEEVDRIIAANQTVAPVPLQTLQEIGMAAARRVQRGRGLASHARTSALSGGLDGA